MEYRDEYTKTSLAEYPRRSHSAHQGWLNHIWNRSGRRTIRTYAVQLCARRLGDRRYPRRAPKSQRCEQAVGRPGEQCSSDRPAAECRRGRRAPAAGLRARTPRATVRWLDAARPAPVPKQSAASARDGRPMPRQNPSQAAALTAWEGSHVEEVDRQQGLEAAPPPPNGQPEQRDGRAHGPEDAPPPPGGPAGAARGSGTGASRRPGPPSSPAGAAGRSGSGAARRAATGGALQAPRC